MYSVGRTRCGSRWPSWDDMKREGARKGARAPAILCAQNWSSVHTQHYCRSRLRVEQDAIEIRRSHKLSGSKMVNTKRGTGGRTDVMSRQRPCKTTDLGGVQVLQAKVSEAACD